MIIKIYWKETEDAAQTIGTIMCEIPHSEHMPISCHTDKNGENDMMVTTISNEGDK